MGNNIRKYEHLLDLCNKMWSDPLVFHYQNTEPAPPGIKSIFLAGPSSRDDVLEFKWRILAVNHLRKSGFTGVIYVPEPTENDWSFKKTFPMEIVRWESERLLSADLAFFWLPRHQVQLPGRVTNTELGFHLGMAYALPEKYKSRIILGCPADAWKVKSEMHWASIPNIEVFDDLEVMCLHAASKLL